MRAASSSRSAPSPSKACCVKGDLSPSSLLHPTTSTQKKMSPKTHPTSTWSSHERQCNLLPSYKEQHHRSRMNYTNKNPTNRLPTWRKAIVKARSALTQHRAKIAMEPMPSGIVRAPISDALPPFAKHKKTRTHTPHSPSLLSPSLPLLRSTKLYNYIQRSVFFFGENSPFCQKKQKQREKSQTTWSTCRKFPKNRHISRIIFVGNHQDFRGIWAAFLAFFFWNCHI